MSKNCQPETIRKEIIKRLTKIQENSVLRTIGRHRIKAKIIKTEKTKNQKKLISIKNRKEVCLKLDKLQLIKII